MNRKLTTTLLPKMKDLKGEASSPKEHLIPLFARAYPKIVFFEHF